MTFRRLGFACSSLTRISSNNLDTGASRSLYRVVLRMELRVIGDGVLDAASSHIGMNCSDSEIGGD